MGKDSAVIKTHNSDHKERSIKVPPRQGKGQKNATDAFTQTHTHTHNFSYKSLALFFKYK